MREDIRFLRGMRESALTDIAQPDAVLAARARQRATDTVDDVTQRLADCAAKARRLAFVLGLA